MGKTLGKLLEENLGGKFEGIYDYKVHSPMSLDDDCHIHVMVLFGPKGEAVSEYFIDFENATVRTGKPDTKKGQNK